MKTEQLRPEEQIVFETFASKKMQPKINDEVEEHKIACEEYLARATAMPYNDIKQALLDYDSSSPKMDEIKFVRDLQEKYQQSEENVLKRIKDVRRLLKYDGMFKV